MMKHLVIFFIVMLIFGVFITTGQELDEADAPQEIKSMLQEMRADEQRQLATVQLRHEDFPVPGQQSAEPPWKRVQGAQVRMGNRPAHVDYLKSFGDKLHAAGPTLDAAGNMNGSVVILDLESSADAEAFAVNDPYAQAGLFDKVTIQPWKKVLP